MLARTELLVGGRKTNRRNNGSRMKFPEGIRPKPSEGCLLHRITCCSTARASVRCEWPSSRSQLLAFGILSRHRGSICQWEGKTREKILSESLSLCVSILCLQIRKLPHDMAEKAPAVVAHECLIKMSKIIPDGLSAKATASKSEKGRRKLLTNWLS